MNIIIFTATGTDIGKTYLTLNLINYLKSKNKNFHAIKPIISGYEPQDEFSDTNLIAKSLGTNHDKVSLYRLKMPISPNIAAKQEGVALDYSKLIDFAHFSATSTELLIIETAGGLFSPITNEKTVNDFVCDISASPLCDNMQHFFIIGDYLGTISHTISAIKASNRKVDRVIMNCKTPPSALTFEVANTIEGSTRHKVHIFYNQTCFWDDFILKVC
jgi:dethiobiotin synthetase